ncbi:MAG: S1C family serine protease [Clostridium sp.]|uniref:S1C family serine protease n=1 Tax=Clostridium sp. TaxID=1506 RepID=UPI003EE68821
MSKNNEKREGSINIKNKTPLFTRNNLYIFIIIIVTAIITGAITTKYVTDKFDGTIKNAVNSVESNTITENIIKEVGPSLVTIGSSPENLEQIEVNDTNATGVIINKDGLIITDYDLIRGMKNIYVRLQAKGIEPKKAIFLGYDKETGIAVLKINEKNLTPIQYTTSLNAKAGDTVLAIGNATNSNYVGMVTPGILTSTNYSITVDGEKNRLLQTNAIMSSQNYGGVICNSKGQMIGFNSEYLTKKYNLNGLYFAIGMDTVQESIQNVLDKTNVLGIDGAELENGKGFYVTDVRSGTPASKAGIGTTDIIESINGNKIEDLNDFYNEVKSFKEGATIKLQVLKDGNSREINITI